MKETIVYLTHAIHNSYRQLCGYRRDLLRRTVGALQSTGNINFCEDEDTSASAGSLTNYPNYRPRIGVISRALHAAIDRPG